VNRPVFERIIVRLRLVFLIIPLNFRAVAFSCPVVDATPLPFVQVERGKIYSRSRCREFFFSFGFSRRSVCLNWNRDKQEPLKSSVLIFLVCWGTVHLFTFALRSGCSLYRLFSRNVRKLYKNIYRTRKNIYFRLRLWNFFVRFSRRSVSLNWNWVKEEPLKSSVLIFCLLRNLPASALRTGIPFNEQIIFPQNTVVWYIFNTRALVAPKYFLSFLYGYTVIIYCFRTFMTRQSCHQYVTQLSIIEKRIQNVSQLFSTYLFSLYKSVVSEYPIISLFFPLFFKTENSR
jgi:hypothetical protein